MVIAVVGLAVALLGVCVGLVYCVVRMARQRERFAAIVDVDAEVSRLRRTTAQEIAQWCRDHLAPQKVPRYVLFVNDLPHTPTHKVANVLFKKDPTLKQRATDLQATR